MAKVVGFIEAPRIGLGLPLDIRGTALPTPAFGGGEGEGRGPTIEPDLHFVLDRVGRWSLDDVE